MVKISTRWHGMLFLCRLIYHPVILFSLTINKETFSSSNIGEIQLLFIKRKVHFFCDSYIQKKPSMNKKTHFRIFGVVYIWGMRQLCFIFLLCIMNRNRPEIIAEKEPVNIYLNKIIIFYLLFFSICIKHRLYLLNVTWKYCICTNVLVHIQIVTFIHVQVWLFHETNIHAGTETIPNIQLK